MGKKVHFKDNLFYLTKMIDTLSEGLVFELDTELFLDKCIDDILFFNSALTRTYNLLQAHRDLVEFSEQLRNLYSIQKKYTKLLMRIINDETAFSDEFKPFIFKFNEIMKTVDLDSNTLRDKIEHNHFSVTHADVVSQDEMATLLQISL